MDDFVFRTFLAFSTRRSISFKRGIFKQARFTTPMGEARGDLFYAAAGCSEAITSEITELGRWRLPIFAVCR